MERPARRGIDRLRDTLGSLDRNCAGDLARRLNDLDPDLGLDLALVIEAVDTLVSTLDLNRDHLLDRARSRASDLASSVELARAAADAREFAHARESAAARARELASALESAAVRARELASARDCARGRAVDRVRDLDRDLPRDLVRDLVRDRGLAGNLAVYLAFHSVAHEVRERVTRSANSMPGRVVAVAVRMLPASERLRYREEFRSELLESEFLTRPRWKQLGCALWLLARTPALRWALKDPARRVER